MRKVLAREGTLDDGLVCAPVEQVIEGHAEEEHRPRDHRRQRVCGVDGVEFLSGYVFHEVAKPGEKAPVAQDAHSENRHQEAANQQSDSVDGVRNRNGFQAAENCVNCANQPNPKAQQRDGCELAQPEQLVKVENTVERQRTGIQHGRQIGEQISEQEQE